MLHNLFKRAYLRWLLWAYADLTSENPLHPDIPGLMRDIQAINLSSQPVCWDELFKYLIARMLYVCFLVLAYQCGRLAA